MLVHALNGFLFLRLRTFADQPKYFADAVTQRPNSLNPLRHIFLSSVDRLAKPVTVFRKVEFAGPTGNGAAVLDCVQEFTVLECLQLSGANPGYFVPTPVKVLHQIVQAAAVDTGMALKALQRADLVIQLTQHLAANIAARQDCENFKQRGYCGPSRQVVVSIAVLEHRVVEELKSQKRPHTLRQGLLVVRNVGGRPSSDFSSRFDHFPILRYPVAGGK